MFEILSCIGGLISIFGILGLVIGLIVQEAEFALLSLFSIFLGAALGIAAECNSTIGVAISGGLLIVMYIVFLAWILHVYIDCRKDDQEYIVYYM